MENKVAVPGAGIEIIRPDRRIAVSGSGVEIRHEDKPVTGEVAGTGFVYLVVDCSGSMAGDKLRQAKRGAISFAKEARMKGYCIGLICFHSVATHVCGPVRDISLFNRYVERMEVSGFTHMAEAIHLAHQKFNNEKGNRVAVVVTDGGPNGPGDPEASLHAGEMAKKDGIDIIAVGTDDADRQFLAKLASRTELGVKVPRVQLQRAIASAAKVLPQLGTGQSAKGEKGR